MSEKYTEIPVDFSRLATDDYETLTFAINALSAAQQTVTETWGEMAVAVWIMGWEPEDA